MQSKLTRRAVLAGAPGPGRYPGLRVEQLFGDEVFPVCSAGLCEGPSPLREPGVVLIISTPVIASR